MGGGSRRPPQGTGASEPAAVAAVPAGFIARVGANALPECRRRALAGLCSCRSHTVSSERAPVAELGASSGGIAVCILSTSESYPSDSSLLSIESLRECWELAFRVWKGRGGGLSSGKRKAFIWIPETEVPGWISAKGNLGEGGTWWRE